MSEKILYVSDLDGTLLTNEKKPSEFTINTINNLIERGVMFTFATARSFVTASEVSKGIKLKLPFVSFNGTFIVSNDGEILKANYFEKADAQNILEELLKSKIKPLVFSHIDGNEKFSYDKSQITPEISRFLKDHKNDKRENPVELLKINGDVFHFTCIDKKEKLKPLFERYKEKFSCVLYKDMYSGDYWFEIQPKVATKGNGIIQLKELLGCDRVVCFGDGVNDTEMFLCADECYAVSNADEKLKEIATTVIESNNNDGVAKWLLNYIDKY